MDNIYMMNYLVGRELEKGKKVVAALVDLKAAINSVDREVLARRLREEKVSRRLRERIMEIYKETRSVVKVGGKWGKIFWTTKGVRQGCSLSPMLFNVLIADIERELGRDGIGGITVGGKKLRVLGYADDLVILAKGEEEMRWILKRLEGDLERKELVLYTEETKIIRFRKGSGRIKKVKWWWGEKR